LRGILRFLVRELGRLVGFERKLHGLPGVLMSGQVIFFSMMHCGGAMSVRGLFVKLSGALMGIIWHGDPFSARLTDMLRFSTGYVICAEILDVQLAVQLYCIELISTYIQSCVARQRTGGIFETVIYIG
jgi:hypothetical protein